MRLSKFRFAALLFLLAFPSSNARAWAREGHEVVVLIALRLMDSVQRENVYALLETHDAYEIGNWADIYGKTGDTAMWHWVDIPAEDADYKASDCEPVCIISQLKWAKAYVSDHTHSKVSRRIALLWWFHLTGDLHQPFHCYNNNDRGGNGTPVTFASTGETMKLHGLWDYGIIDRKQPYADSLERAVLNACDTKPRLSESFIKAANRGHKRAIDAAQIPNLIITQEYLNREWPVVLQSLWEAACMAAEIGPEI